MAPTTSAEEVVSALRRFISRGEYGLKEVPQLVKEVIQGGYWRERSVPFAQFEAFVAHPPMEGLGADMATIKRLCSEDKEALDLIDQTTGHRQGERTDLLDNIQEVSEDAPTGTSAARALRRLRKDRLDLHARVLAGELTPHGAMVEAGFRKRPIQCAPTPSAAAAAIRERFTPEQIAELVRLLGAAA